jgi:hypothetical protein
MPDPTAEAPRAELLPPMMRRRTSLLTRMAAEVAQQAGRAARLGAEHASIYGSVYGEIRTTIELLEGLLDPGAPLSPTKFHNSVHNTAAGYVSIAGQNRSGTAALTAGRSTVAMGLLECAGLVADAGAPALLVLAEEPLAEPLADGRRWGPLAAAFALAPADLPVPPDMSFRTCRLVQGEQRAGVAPGLPPGLADNPCAPALAVVDAWVGGAAAALALEPHRARGWLLELDAGEGRA